MSDGETDFAAFEAQISSGEDVVAEVKEVEAKAEIPEPEKAEEPDTPAEDTPDAEEEGRKRRSKPAHLRIAELTAKLRDAERKLEERAAPKEEAKAPERPDPNAYEFGEADPAYIDALTDWKLDTRDAERAKATEASQEQQQLIAKVTSGVSSAEVAGKAKYADFEAKVAAAVEARDTPLPPPVTVAVAMSPVGGDLIYRLATDEAASEKIESLAQSGAMRPMAMAIGELEGEYTDDDSDLDVSDDLDMARMLGRMRTRMKGGAKPAVPVVEVTKAPEPPQERARGGGGKFEVGGDTNDFAAFERMANAKR